MAMQTVPLGASGLQLSRVVFGAMQLGPAASAETARIATLHAALEHGCTSIDTAPLYEFGRSEEVVGRALRGVRERVQLLTKVGLRWDAEHGEVLFRFHDEHGQPRAVRRDSRPESVRLDVERSLARLGVDALDLVQVHHRDRLVPIGETMDALAQLHRAGLVRAIGVCNFEPDEVEEARRALGAVPLCSHQLAYSLVRRGAERALLPQAARAGMAVLAYSPLEQGLLAGRTRASLAREDGRLGSAAFQRANAARVARAMERALEPLAAARGVRVAQISLAWLLAQPACSAVIVGASSPEQARENAAAAAIVLAPTEVAAIRATFEGVRFDSNAGEGPAEHLLRRARRVIGRLRRLLRSR